MSRGPLAKSATVHQLHGNPSKKNLKSVIDSLQPEVEIPGCPPHLLKEAKKEWKRITPILERYGLISQLDRAALSQYCQQWALLVYAETQINRMMIAAEKKRKVAEANGDVYEGSDGLIEVTKNGNVIYSPYYIIAKNSRYQLDRMLANFGMSPAARGRVSPSNRLQADMFGDGSGEGDVPAGGGFGSL